MAEQFHKIIFAKGVCCELSNWNLENPGDFVRVAVPGPLKLIGVSGVWPAHQAIYIFDVLPDKLRYSKNILIVTWYGFALLMILLTQKSAVW